MTSNIDLLMFFVDHFFTLSSEYTETPLDSMSRQSSQSDIIRAQRQANTQRASTNMRRQASATGVGVGRASAAAATPAAAGRYASAMRNDPAFVASGYSEDEQVFNADDSQSTVMPLAKYRNNPQVASIPAVAVATSAPAPRPAPRPAAPAIAATPAPLPQQSEEMTRILAGLQNTASKLESVSVEQAKIQAQLANQLTQPAQPAQPAITSYMTPTSTPNPMRSSFSSATAPSVPVSSRTTPTPSYMSNPIPTPTPAAPTLAGSSSFINSGNFDFDAKVFYQRPVSLSTLTPLAFASHNKVTVFQIRERLARTQAAAPTSAATPNYTPSSYSMGAASSASISALPSTTAANTFGSSLSPSSFASSAV